MRREELGATRRLRFEEVPASECIELVRTQPVGRLAVPLAGRPPLVVPVNFAVHGDAIVFRTEIGAKSRRLSGRLVSFQVDHFDAERRTGWSVLIQGRASEARRGEVEDVDVDPWVPGDHPYWFRIPTARVTGRRIRTDTASD